MKNVTQIVTQANFQRQNAKPGQFSFIIPEKKAVISVNESINNATAIKTLNLFLEKVFPIIYQQLK